jgi:hypothetical protein
MMEIVGGEENVKRCVVRMQGQFREKKWHVHDYGRQQNEAERYGPLRRGDRISSLQDPLSKGAEKMPEDATIIHIDSY